ncbi:HNH endonuclease [Sedimentimonas flavescens]|uniref:HNH endonuclease n=1 Tax=Sedimentimonas flavescens TaxID=2851012 RepID=UPI0021E6F24E|nr:HNH endonuclease signature motif containing protein [Sedimentimonas flavescens]
MLSARNSEHYEVIERTEIENRAKAARMKQLTADECKLIKRSDWLLQNPVFLKRPPLGTEKPIRRNVNNHSFQRSPEVIAWTRWNAGGKCELCQRNAPFTDRNGLPFLEVHHVVPLAEGGSDTIENAVAICPNCHRAVHLSEEAATLRAKLIAIIERLRV